MTTTTTAIAAGAIEAAPTLVPGMVQGAVAELAPPGGPRRVRSRTRPLRDEWRPLAPARAAASAAGRLGGRVPTNRKKGPCYLQPGPLLGARVRGFGFRDLAGLADDAGFAAVLIAHVGMDRAAAYGLKLPELVPGHASWSDRTREGMSPARAPTSTEEIIAAGRALLESGGLEAVTMQAVAARSACGAILYKRSHRSALIAAIGAAALDDLARAIAPPSEDPDAAAGLRGVAVAYRTFAHANPRAYELLFMSMGPESRPPSASNALAAAPLLALTDDSSGARGCRGGSPHDRLRAWVRVDGAGRSVPLRWRHRRGLSLRGRRPGRRAGWTVSVGAEAQRSQPSGRMSSQPDLTPKS